jgi:hypothetical protein
MQGLKLDNINFITEEVSKSGITFSHLMDELIDHICCEVEKELEKGLSFEKAYENVKIRIPINKLDKIQEDTLKLIDKKYRIMKNTMKIIGLVSLTLMAFGALFKIQHWSGSGIMLLIGFLLLGVVFLPSALYVWKKESKLKGSLSIYLTSVIGSILFLVGILFKVQHYPGAAILIIFGFMIIGLILIPMILIAKLREEQSKGMKATYVIGAVSIITYLFGDLFKINHWPGALPLLVMGAIGITSIFLPMYVSKIYKNGKKIETSFIFICVGLLFFNLFVLLLSLKVSPNVMSFFNKSGNEINKTTKILETENNTLIDKYQADSIFHDSVTGISIKRIKLLSDELFYYIQNIKVELISACDRVDYDEAQMKAKDVSLILQKDNYSIPTNYMMGWKMNSKANELKQKLDNYKKMLIETSGLSESTKKNIDRTIDTKNRVDAENDTKIDWGTYYFYHTALIISLQHLSTFQERVRISELEVIESLIRNQKVMASQKK